MLNVHVNVDVIVLSLEAHVMVARNILTFH